MSGFDLPLSRYLHDKQITNAATAKLALSKMNETQLVELSGDCTAIIKSISQNKPASRLFNFSASNSICGAGSSCYGLSCRVREAADLGKFASLYGDCVTMPDFLTAHRDEYRAYRESPSAIARYRDRLQGDIVVLALYEPLFMEGLIRFNSNKVAHCNNCLARQITSGQKKTTIKKSPALVRLATDILTQRVTYRFDGNNRISFQDPVGYTDLDGHSVIINDSSAFRNIGSGDVSINDVRETKIANNQAAKIVDDILQQNMGQMLDSATFLTPRRIDGILLDSLNSSRGQEVIEPSILPANLAHTIPIVNDSPFEALVNVRHEDEAYFERYKNSLATVLRQLGQNPTPRMVREALEEEVKPHLLKIDQVLKANQDRQKKKAKQNIAITGITVTLGLAVANNYHLDTGAAMGLLGSIVATPVYKTIDSILNRKVTPKEVAEEQYYFLWQRNKLASQVG